jgi:hypothetical protein
VVGEDGKVAHFQHVSKVLHGLVDDQQLSVICAVFMLCQIEFRGEGEGLQDIVDIWPQHNNHSGSGGVHNECKLCGWVSVCW